MIGFGVPLVLGDLLGEFLDRASGNNQQS